jgi:hypothetical protein
MRNVIHTRTRMGALRSWERFVLRRGSFVVSVIVISLITTALITFLSIHIG